MMFRDMISRERMGKLHRDVSVYVLLLLLSGCGGGISGTGSGGSNQDTTIVAGGQDLGSWAGIASIAGFNFQADAGIRLACASVPRIDKVKDVFYLYHSSALDSGSSTQVAVSADGFTFGESQAVAVRFRQDGSEKPPIETDRAGFSEIVQLPTVNELADPVGAQTCAPLAYRIFHHNAALGGFGDAITSDCSEDGQWFVAETGERLRSADGGNVGVTTAFALDNNIHLFAMDGKSPNDSGEYRHRVWHYMATDGRGDQFELMSDDPLDNGPTIEAKDRQNDPASMTLDTGGVVLLTMKQHNGPINPPGVLTGEIYGWFLPRNMILAVNGMPVPPNYKVQPLTPAGTAKGSPLIAIEDFVRAGHDVYSINDPSMIALPDGSFRMFVGALVNVEHYADTPSLPSCAMELSGSQYSWVILSATSVPKK